MNEQGYTVFARWHDNSYRHGRDCYFPPLGGEPESLPERIEYVRNFHGADSFLPVAWSTARISFDDLDVEFAAALAAGRLIEKTASGWVALGAEKQHPDEFDISEYTSDELRKGEPTSADLAMIARDGPAKPLVTNWIGLCAAPVSTAKPNPFPAFRSPDCDSGPSDHLNASRHQMAAKQFDKA